MNIKGKVIAMLPILTGESKNGVWKSQDSVLETDGQYPQKICFNLFGDKIDQFQFKIGDDVDVSFDIDSREYNGRWYTTVRAWKVEVGSATSNTKTPTQGIPEPNKPESDLPF